MLKQKFIFLQVHGQNQQKKIHPVLQREVRLQNWQNLFLGQAYVQIWQGRSCAARPPLSKRIQTRSAVQVGKYNLQSGFFCEQKLSRNPLR